MARSAAQLRPLSRTRPFRLGYLVHDVSRLQKVVADRAMKPLGITRSQWWVLANLSRHEGGEMTQTELASILDVSKVSLGQLLDRLEQSGFILRRQDGADRRVKRIFLTQDGEALLSVIQARAESLNMEMVDGLSEDEIAAAEAMLRSLKARLLQMNDRLRKAGPEDAEP